MSASFSATASIDSGAVSAGVGFDVTAGYGVSDSQSVTVPEGEVYTVTAYPLYDLWTFDVDGGLFEEDGTGEAYRPLGVCFAIV